MSENPCVLVAYDFSEGSAGALLEARRLSDSLNARLELVHVREGGEAVPWQVDLQILAHLAAVELDPALLVTRSGLPWVEVARRARECGATLLVIGSHGRSGFRSLALGSTAVKLAIQSSCPVVLVGPRAVKRATRLRSGQKEA